MNTEKKTHDLTSPSAEQYVEDEADIFFDQKKKKKKHSAIIRRIILIIAGLVFCYSAFNLIQILLEYKQGNDIYETIQNQVLDENPTTVVISDDDSSQEVEIPFKYDHNALLSINQEGVGYFYLPSVDTRLPVVQSTDNDFYLTHTFDKTYNKNGCLFEDYRITGGLSSSNVIIYGHNMNNGSMFGQLNKYKSYNFWNTEGNDVFYIYTENRIMEYRIFSVYISEPVSDTYTFNFNNPTSMREYAQAMKNQSLYDTGVDISNSSQIVTLSTCTDNGEKRFIVHGTYIGQNSLED